MTHTITLIPGDGIGPEVTDAVVRILESRRRLDRMGARTSPASLAFERTGQALPVELLDSIRRNKVALKGPVTTPIGEGLHERQRRPAQGARPLRQPAAGVEPAGRRRARFSGVDLVIVRENTEDLYAGLEHEVVPGVVESLKIITERGVDAHRAVRVRARAAARAQEGDRRSTKPTS